MRGSPGMGEKTMRKWLAGVGIAVTMMRRFQGGRRAAGASSGFRSSGLRLRYWGGRSTLRQGVSCVHRTLSISELAVPDEEYRE